MNLRNIENLQIIVNPKENVILTKCRFTKSDPYSKDFSTFDRSKRKNVSKITLSATCSEKDYSLIKSKKLLKSAGFTLYDCEISYPNNNEIKIIFTTYTTDIVEI